MVPNFLIAETTVRESGESDIFDSGESSINKSLVLTLGITHAVEQESMEVAIYGSADGVTWTDKPLISFPPKFYCGNYELVLDAPRPRYLKAGWKVSRWSRGDNRPYFSFYIFSRLERVRAMVSAA
jgi:hypothetical protein